MSQLGWWDTVDRGHSRRPPDNWASSCRELRRTPEERLVGVTAVQRGKMHVSPGILHSGVVPQGSPVANLRMRERTPRVRFQKGLSHRPSGGLGKQPTMHVRSMCFPTSWSRTPVLSDYPRPSVRSRPHHRRSKLDLFRQPRGGGAFRSSRLSCEAIIRTVRWLQAGARGHPDYRQATL